MEADAQKKWSKKTKPVSERQVSIWTKDQNVNNESMEGWKQACWNKCESWYCFICKENFRERMICCACERWVHVDCVELMMICLYAKSVILKATTKHFCRLIQWGVSHKLDKAYLVNLHIYRKQEISKICRHKDWCW